MSKERLDYSAGKNRYRATNGDDLHNYNAYCYLKSLKEALTKNYPGLKSATRKDRYVNNWIDFIGLPPEKYDPSYPYGNFYTQVQIHVDSTIPDNVTDPRVIAFIEALYLNDNQALETTYETIKGVLEVNNQGSSQAEHEITKRLNQGSNRSGNEYNPQLMEGNGPRLYGVIGPTFTPQYATSMPVIKHFRHQTDSSPTEIRMGTQGQYRLWQPGVSPLFKSWLKIRAKKAPGPNGISHIYFNNLGLDRSGVEGSRERDLTEELDKLNDIDGAAVITLPADKGLFSSGKVFDGSTYATKGAFSNQVTSILTTGRHRDVPVADLRIPKKIKDIIYKDKDEATIISGLLEKSYKAMGLDEKPDDYELTHEEMQAVYFHFIKYELTNYILEETKPKSFNFSCKDGIDRAGSASLIYNFFKSLDAGKPMSQEEFEKNLHGPATMVKGRGMNTHRKRVWSEINQYLNVDTNYNQLNSNPETQWVIRWRDINTPDEKMDVVFNRRSQAILQSIPDNDEPTNNAARDFITECIELGKDPSYDKRFLMDMIYETKSVADASQQPEKEAAVKAAVDHMQEKISKYPHEIKQLSFMEKVGRFFKQVAHAIFGTSNYESTKSNFIGNDYQQSNHMTFTNFKHKTQALKDVQEQDKESEDDHESITI